MSIGFLFLSCLLYEVMSLIAKVIGCNVMMPLMRYKEIIIIKEILKKRKPRMCLEWGTGYSTLYFPKCLEEDFRWISIEHEKQWFKKIKQLIADGRISVYYVPPNQWPPTDPYADGSLADFKDYVEFPERLNEKFDFILVDGRARKFCLIKAFELLRDDGIIVLHDANRQYYHAPFMLYDYQVLFQDSRRDEGGIWIGSKRLILDSFISIDRHKLNWNLLKNLDKLESTFIRWWKRRKIG